GVVDVELGEISMPAADAALEVDRVGGHVVCADLVVDAGASAADCGNNVVARRKLAYVRPDGLHAPEVFMTDREKIESIRSGAVLGGIDLFIGAVDAAAEQPDEHAAAIRDFVQ